MNYSVYSFVALSPLRNPGNPGPAGEQEQPPEPAEALKFAGTASISATGGRWYSRLWQSARGRSPESKVEFEIVLNVPADVRARLGLTPDRRSAVIEIQLTSVTRHE